MQNQNQEINIPKHAHKILWSLLAVLLLVVIVGSYFVWKEMKKTEKSNQQAVNSNQETQNPTADWKTYTNTEYGFEFKYPKDYKITTENAIGFVMSKADDEGGSLISLSNLPTDKEPQYWFGIKKNVFEENKFSSQDSFSHIKVEDQDAVRTYFATSDNYEYGNQVKITFLNNGRVYTFEFTGLNVQEFDQILSTFRFTK